MVCINIICTTTVEALITQCLESVHSLLCCIGYSTTPLPDPLALCHYNLHPPTFRSLVIGSLYLPNPISVSTPVRQTPSIVFISVPPQVLAMLVGLPIALHTSYRALFTLPIGIPFSVTLVTAWPASRHSSHLFPPLVPFFFVRHHYVNKLPHSPGYSNILEV